MSTTATSSTNALPSRFLCNPYSGTAEQPNLVSLFFKSKNGIEIKEENTTHSVHYSPTFYFSKLTTSIWKIEESLNRIFCLDDIPNAFANLGRGIVQLFPVIGGGVLYLYDTVKKHLYINPQIHNALANEPIGTLGIAFDGKVIKKFSLHSMETVLRRQNQNQGQETKVEQPIQVLYYVWLKMLSKAFEKERNQTRLDLANRLTQVIIA